MADFYKFEIANWNEGTANLTLEQEAAYLRVINAIRLADQPITFNMRVLCGLWRCDPRVANRLLNALMEAGKLRIEGDRIVNDKAVEDANSLLATRQLRRISGVAGGQASARARSKSLENNNTGQASASTREEKRREEKNIGADAPPKRSDSALVKDALTAVINPDLAEAFIAHRLKLKKPMTPYAAQLIAGKLRKAQDAAACVQLSIIKGWQDVFPESVEATKGKPAVAGADWWGGRDL